MATVNHCALASKSSLLKRRSALGWAALGACLLMAAGCGQAKDESARPSEAEQVAEQTLPHSWSYDKDDVQSYPAGPELKSSTTSPSATTPDTIAAEVTPAAPPWRRTHTPASGLSDFAPLEMQAETAPTAVQTPLPAAAMAVSPVEAYSPSLVPSADYPQAAISGGAYSNPPSLVNSLAPGASPQTASKTTTNSLLRSGLAPTSLAPSGLAPTSLAPTSTTNRMAEPSYSTAPPPSLSGPASATSSPPVAARMMAQPEPVVAAPMIAQPEPVMAAPLMVAPAEPRAAGADDPQPQPMANARSAMLADADDQAAASAAAPGQADSNPAVDSKVGDADQKIVKVFYGTDRKQLETARTIWATYAPKFYLPAGILAGAGLLFLIASLGVWKKLARPLAWCAAAGAVALGAMAGIEVVRLQQTLAKPGVRYGGERGKLELGVCEVSIPPTHEVGELEAPTIFKFEVREDTNKHLVLLGSHPQEKADFYGQLRERVASSPRKNAFVFVHGFNNSFEESARRTAQLAHDLKFEGAPIFYSWPSQAQLTAYTVDENNVEWTVPHLREFLLELAKESGADSICLIAHSMGNRALTKALQSLSYRLERPIFDEVVLTAPDIDADVFRRDIAPAVARTANRVTLYASSNDEALRVSKQIHGYPRAGDSGGLLVVLPGIETIDVSAVDTTLVGHSYFNSNGSVVSDLICLLNDAKPASQRTGLLPRQYEGLPYWVFGAATVGLPTPVQR